MPRSGTRLAVLIVTCVALLAGCAPAAAPAPSAAPGAPSAEPGASPTGNESGGDGTPSETAAPELSQADRDELAEAVRSGDAAAIEDRLADPVEVVVAASECCGLVTPAEAIAQLAYIQDAPGPWDFALPETTVDGYRESAYYGEFFPEDVLVGRAADGTLVAFGIDGDEVTTLFLGFEGLLQD